MTPDDILARVLHRDGLILVVDKPYGIAVHRGPKGGASLEDSFEHLRFGLPRNPALAHRLDRETSGCLVLGRHHKALEKLGKLFKQGAVIQNLLGGRRRRADRRRGAHRQAARPPRSRPRLVDEGRSAGPAFADPLARAWPRAARRQSGHMAGNVAADRPHPPVARPCGERGLADPRRFGLRRPRARTARRCTCTRGAWKFRSRRRGRPSSRRPPFPSTCA